MALAALGDGTKLTLFIIFKGCRRNKDADKVTGVVIEYTDNGWMNEDKTLRWLKVIQRRHDHDRFLNLSCAEPVQKPNFLKVIFGKLEKDHVF